MVRAGIIGIGNIGFAHASCIFGGQVSGMCLTALCDIDPRRQQAAREHFPGTAVCSDYEELLSREDVDAVIVAVPHPRHAEMAMAAFRAGKHVLVEKPVDITVRKARLLNETAAQSGKVFGIMFNQRTGNLFQKARELVSSGALGSLKRSVWIVTNWYRSQAYYDSGAWRATWSGEGGGVLMNQCPHQLDLWQWICGMPVMVSGFCDEGRFHDIEVEDSATIVAKFENGADGLFITSTGEFPGTNRLEITGTLGKLVLENGVLKWWRLLQDERTVCCAEEENSPRIGYEYQEFHQEKVSGHRAILENFAAAIDCGEPLIAPGQEGIRELTIRCAAYLSAWKGSVPVTIPFDEEEYDTLLAGKQAASRARGQRGGESLHHSYNDRWQINW